MDPDQAVRFRSAIADAGPIIKRMRPRAHGRGYRINKRTSRITIVVKEKE